MLVTAPNPIGHIVVAPDKFKGSATAAGWLQHWHEAWHLRARRER